MLTEPTPYENDLATQIIGCAMIVHLHFGPGFIESVYETCFCHELAKAGLKVARQKRVGVRPSSAGANNVWSGSRWSFSSV